MFIYLIVNSVTGKYYVGQHKGDNLKKYLQQKFYEADRHMGGRSHLYASMRKYGRSAFSIYALRSDIQTKEELDKIEKLFILSLDSRNPEVGYNICKGGEGFTGPHSEEAKKKNSIASRAMWEQPGKRESIVSNMEKVDGKYRVPGAKVGGRKAVKSGQLDSIRPAAWAASAQWRKDHAEEHKKNSSKAGKKVIGSLLKWKKEHPKEDKENSRRGWINARKGMLKWQEEHSEEVKQTARKNACKHWNINRGKPCNCGQHKSLKTQ